MALPAERILHAIHIVRGERVLLDADLAVLYGAETRVLIQAVKRNLERFPADFMFQLTKEEWHGLRSQSVISSSWGGRRSAPHAFTELGVAMLSSVLNGGRAIQVNISIMRAFTQLILTRVQSFKNFTTEARRSQKVPQRGEHGGTSIYEVISP